MADMKTIMASIREPHGAYTFHSQFLEIDIVDGRLIALRLQLWRK